MKALSLWQPWATYIAIGDKRYETRSWATAYRGPLAIHAAKREPDLAMMASGWNLPNWMAMAFPGSGGPAFWPTMVPLGGIIAVCDLVDCVRVEAIRDSLYENELMVGNYDDGRWAWKLTNIRRLKWPHQIRGRQQLFDVDIPGSIPLIPLEAA